MSISCVVAILSTILSGRKISDFSTTGFVPQPSKMRRSFVYIRRFSCAYSNHSFINRRTESTMKRQNSIYPSTIYPRLESVDLQDDNIPPNDDLQYLRDINFENHTEAFKNKTTWEIIRALTVLKMCSVNTMVDNSLGVSYSWNHS